MCIYIYIRIYVYSTGKIVKFPEIKKLQEIHGKFCKTICILYTVVRKCLVFDTFPDIYRNFTFCVYFRTKDT